MSRLHNHLVNTILFLSLLLVLSVAPQTAFAQLNSSASESTPLVYSVENTGASLAAPVFPSFAQLPIIRPLTDPFRSFDGTRDTSLESWEKRRNEIKASIEKYEIGPKPDCHDCTITATYVPATAPTRGTLTINVTRNVNGTDVTITIPTRCYIPNPATQPPMENGLYAAIIPMVGSAGSSNLGRGSLPTAIFAGKPIASCDFPHNSVATYNSPKLTDNFYKLYPDLCAGTTTCAGFPGGVSNSGQYAAWSWGVSRVIDGMKIATEQATNPLPIDMSKIMVTGCSYAGKMALFAGAFDERIALTIAQENGGGGQPAWRVTDEIEAYNKSENIQRTSNQWFASQMWQFAGLNRYKMPTDHHELAAMIAPRALLETGNTGYNWLSNRSNYVSARATQQVYATLGIEDRFGFIIDGGHSHCAVPASQNAPMAAFVDKFLLGNTAADTDVHVTPYPTLDYGRWTAWWGTDNPKFPNDWNPGDGTVVTHMNRPLDINFGDNILAGYDLFMDGAHPDATVSLKGGNVNTDVSCPDGSSYTFAIPLPDQDYTIPAGDNDWYPSPNMKSAKVYQGSTTNSFAAACNGGVVKDVYFSALGVSVGTGNPATAGFVSTDTTDPLNVRFHCNVAGSPNGAGGSWSPTVTVSYQP